MGPQQLIKRSITLKGHRTSLALEAPFWDALDQLARDRGQPLAQIITEVDAERDGGLASALRVLVLEAARAGQLASPKA
ncbi:ribbon-helix-helix domain-containing protein [Parvularcula sp. LCG005]|uniref:ribbon-helix-helix domain-containing protein n=1 Tax=Parvularcula sp. LCG005 TaxID=3078805 RepID=UPI0029428AC4|nr:ribbon-helix-helix domain-containing protein [Parvularcula sp. LCG005]WOI54801.1 ribbon-helix-helix domain-containing protein [Parvularcula sp. LCG005]